jgi:DNA-binding GntR family transcriptional regulator
MTKTNVYEDLKQKILLGHYKPGDLLSDPALMKEYNIGKTPLREVFFHLQRDGLIRRYARVGTIVAPIDMKRVAALAEIRHYFEWQVAKLAVKRITDTILEKMDACLRKMEDAVREGNFSTFAEEEARLHSLLYTATGNVIMKEFIEEHYSLFTRLWFTVERTPADLTEQLEQWKAICQALRERDEEKAIASNVKHFDDYFSRLTQGRSFGYG